MMEQHMCPAQALIRKMHGHLRSTGGVLHEPIMQAQKPRSSCNGSPKRTVHSARLGDGKKRVMNGRASKAVFYTRVSSDQQIENTSLTEQHAACMAKAKAIGAQVVGSYEDPGVSGGLYLARPGIQQALADLESGKANTLIIAKFDRCSRDREHQSAIKKRVARAGARLIFCDMEFPDSPEGDLQYGIMGSFAEYERMLIRQRCMDGARRRAQEGVQTKTAMRPLRLLYSQEARCPSWTL
jgi:DNA invertase Pin-like site-specific DNA recombinase